MCRCWATLVRRSWTGTTNGFKGHAEQDEAAPLVSNH